MKLTVFKFGSIERTVDHSSAVRPSHNDGVVPSHSRRMPHRHDHSLVTPEHSSANGPMICYQQHGIRMGWYAFALLALTAPGLAQSRPVTTNLTCAQTQALVNTSGSAVLSKSATTYDRFVSSGASCSLGDRAEFTAVMTSDDPYCQMRVCRPSSRGGG